MASVANNRPELQEMDLAGCNAVSDDALSMLMDSFPQLHPDKVVSLQKGDAFCTAAAKQVCPRVVFIEGTLKMYHLNVYRIMLWSKQIGSKVDACAR